MQKLTVKELNQNFDLSEWPLFESVEYDITQADVALLKFNFKVDKSLIYFTGHFPEQAVLPGVVQVHWAGELARHCLDCEGFRSLKKVKFNAVILPSTALILTLTLSYKPRTGSLSFVYEDQQKKYSSGAISFSEQA